MSDLKTEKSETTAEERSLSCLQILRVNLLSILTMIGVGVGFAIGFGIKKYDPSPSALMWIGLPGEVYLRIIKMMIVPLIICSVISATATLEPRSNGKISVVCLGYIMVTNFLTTIIGTILCVLIKPGEGIGTDVNLKSLKTNIETEDIFADLIRNVFPDNLVTACFLQAQTKYDYDEVKVNKTLINGTIYTATVRELKKSVGTASSTNILGRGSGPLARRWSSVAPFQFYRILTISYLCQAADSLHTEWLIVVSSMFGVATSAMKSEGMPFLAFFKSATLIILKIMRVMIWSTPIGSCSLVAKNIASTSDVEETFRKLGLYILTVMVGLAIWALIVVPVAYTISKRKNPFRFYGTGMPSIMIVFATQSTMIALPETLRTLEDQNGVDKRVSRFVAPISATLGRAGSSLYICVSCLFIVQLVDMEVDAARAILVIILTTLSTLAIPSVAGASLVTVLILLTALNIPGEAAAMLFALEWLLDRSRSCTNMCTQLYGAIFTDRLCQYSLLTNNQSISKESVTLEVEKADGRDLQKCNMETNFSVNTKM